MEYTGLRHVPFDISCVGIFQPATLNPEPVNLDSF